MAHKGYIGNYRLAWGEVYGVSNVLVNGKPAKILAAKPSPGKVFVAQPEPKECKEFCEQCGDCLDCYLDEHEDGCSNI